MSHHWSSMWYCCRRCQREWRVEGRDGTPISPCPTCQFANVGQLISFSGTLDATTGLARALDPSLGLVNAIYRSN
jgi:hypothetical protein